MKRIRIAILLSAIVAVAGTEVYGQVADAPTLVRSIPIDHDRGSTVRPDGTALSVSRDGVIRRDPAGGTRFVARLRGNQRAALGPEARAFGVVTYADNAPTTLHAFRFEVFDETGEPLWSVQKPKAAEFKVGWRGLWTVGVAGADGMLESELYLYDSLGNEAANWRVPYLSNLTLTKFGDRFFAASRRELFAYPYDGGEPHPFGRFEKFATSTDGRWVVTFGAGTFSVFDGNTLAWVGKSDLEPVRALSISADGRYVAIGGGDRLELYDRTAGGLAWTVTSGNPELRFISAAVGGDPLRVVCGLDEDKGPGTPSAERHTSGAVFLLDIAGKMLWRDDLSYKDWNFQVPAVSFSDDGKQFEVTLADEHRHYHLP